jgi:hypothetical protein
MGGKVFEEIKSHIFTPKISGADIGLGWELTDGFIATNNLRAMRLKLFNKIKKEARKTNSCFSKISVYKAENCPIQFFHDEIFIFPRKDLRGNKLQTSVIFVTAERTILTLRFIFKSSTNAAGFLIKDFEKTTDKYLKRITPYDEYVKSRLEGGCDLFADDYDRGSEEWIEGNSIISSYMQGWSFAWIDWQYPNKYLYNNLNNFGISNYEYKMWSSFYIKEYV